MSLKGGTAELVFAATDAQSVEAVGVGKTGLVIQYLDNVSGKAARVDADEEWRVADGGDPAAAKRRPEDRIHGRWHRRRDAFVREPDIAARALLRD